MVSLKFLSILPAILASVPLIASAPAEGRTHNGKTTAARPTVYPHPLNTGKKFPDSPRRTKTCFIDALGGGQDDGPQILAAAKKCNNGGTLAFLDDLYTIGSPLDLTFLKHVDFDIQGTLKFTDDIDFWIRNQFHYYYQNITSFWQIGGEDVNMFGSGKGVIDGSGQKWYDMYDVQKLNTTFLRPMLIVFDGIKGGQVSGLKFRNSPNWNTFIGNSSDMIFDNMRIEAASTSKIQAKNTDGFDTYRSDNIVIQNSDVNNGDDCVSLRGNSTNILIQSLHCNGSHGISVGSLGQYYQNQDIVENVYVFNITMENASDGARIKAWPGIFGEAIPGWVGGGGTGYVNNVTYDTMLLNNVDLAIEITQCYGQKNLTACNEAPSSLEIKNVFFHGFYGVASKKYDPQVGSLICSSPSVCHDIHAWNINVLSPTAKAPYYSCYNMDTSLLGFTCKALT
ncbi:hypothetical protein H072_10990 [Dactylellina haptotyla CBS 200.50]|uniref:galacturonan 1,4-alpha-galacturonidase n=1 Tax=Dactylellina haptotyla (strain CBS 200.50) TaxID=1284197 RepID=S8BK46_DACHA|nr:hypothetical protein H072_10990 [Dactylellina haptotyla CBS 200.50]